MDNKKIIPNLDDRNHLKFILLYVSALSLLNFDKIRIQMKDKMCVHVDGEHVGFFEDITFECIPHALKIRGWCEYKLLKKYKKFHNWNIVINATQGYNKNWGVRI